MRITFIVPDAGLLGGLRVIAIYAERLQQRGHEVCVVAVPPKRNVRRALRSLLHGKPVHRPDRKSYFADLPIEHRRLPTHAPVVDRDVPDADVVVATWWETADWVARLSPEKGAKAYFVQDYGAHGGQPLDQVAATWHLPMHKLSISRWLMELIAEHGDGTEVTYVPNSVDMDQFNSAPRNKQPHPTVGLMYSTRIQKGLDVMLAAIEHARRDVPDLHVSAFGPNDPDPHLPLPPGSAYFRGAPESRLKDIYGMCDAWLFGSRKEGFGLPILEAMACRTPVIAVPTGAAPELIEAGGGVLVEPEDPRSMADAIVGIARMGNQRWREMSDTALRTAAQYSWNDATDRFEQGLMRSIERSKALQCA